MIVGLSLAAAIAGALLLYLGYRKREPGPQIGGTAGRAAGWLLLALALGGMLSHFGVATAVFVLLTALMLVFTIAPPLAAWIARPRSGKQG